MSFTTFALASERQFSAVSLLVFLLYVNINLNHYLSGKLVAYRYARFLDLDYNVSAEHAYKAYLTADRKAEIGKVLLHLRRPAYLLDNLRLCPYRQD